MGIPTTYTEPELVRSLKERDEKSFIYLYNHYSGALYSIVLQIVPNQELANDILHDAFLETWRKIDRYDEKRCRLFSWMLHIVRNLSLDTIRSKAYQDVMKNQEMPDVIPMNIDSRLTELPVDDFGIKKLLGKMKAEAGSLIELSYFKGYTIEEISEIEEIPLAAVKTKLALALTELRKHLK